jgi:predicted enzyme related to lactoylglutathione lyase
MRRMISTKPDAKRGRFGRAGVLLIAGTCLAGGLGASLAEPARALPFQVPAIQDPPGHEHHVGKMVFVELVTPDLAAAERFYAGLFGWTYGTTVHADGTDYAQASLDGIPVAGLLQRPMPAGRHAQPAWLGFLAVRDADAAAKAAVLNGGHVIVPAHDVPDRGREAVLTDPQGAVFAVIASSSGDPPDLLGEPGEWIWSSLLAKNPETDAAFYQILFGYEVFEADPAARHLILASDGLARASANALPGEPGRAHPHWLNFVRVEDADAMAAKVVALGGKVLVPSRADRQGGRIAVVADPMGAPFGLIEWSETAQPESTQ